MIPSYFVIFYTYKIKQKDFEEMADEKSRPLHHSGRLARLAGHHVPSGRPIGTETTQRW